VNVCVLTLAIAYASGVTENEASVIGVGGLMHDIGKSMISLEILDKPGPLSDEERKVIMNHPVESERILREMGNMPEAAIAIAGQHHEKVNGSGYPRGLTGDQMHPFASMSAVADVYDALTSPRPYKPGLPPHIALRVVFDGNGTEFDTGVVETFIKSLGIYPVGSFVKLNTSEMGIVTEVNPEDSLRPKVGVIFTKFGKQRTSPYPVDLAQEFKETGPEYARMIVAQEDPRRHNINIEDWLATPM
jgi:HD-GYP domain-containing protein (c-di-GMP phosphodiesterase class II)